jgi:choline dehydrogenase-like flavoprotein
MHDALVIGSGAGGGPLALVFAQAGLDVLVLEKGPRYRPEDHRRAPGGLLPGALIPAVEDDPHTVVTRKTTDPLLTQLGWISSCVGGGTVHMGAYFYRFHPDDFRMRDRFGADPFGDGHVELVDWPFGYDELEPWYSRAEWEVGVAGEAGADPFEGPRSRPYPLPPLDAHPVADALEELCRHRGLHPFPTPRAINSRPYQGRPACEYCAICAGLGCPVGARGTSADALLPRAEATGRCTVRAGAMVREITTGADGQATGCVWIDADGREHVERARVVCLSASAVESARLLLLSRSARFPDGLANGSGRVGRNLQFHGVSMGEARFSLERHPELGTPRGFLGRSVADFYFLPEGVSPLAKGGMLRFGKAPQAVTEDHPALRGDDGPAHLYCEVFHDFLPNADSWVELDPRVRDRWGLPVARIHLDRPRHHVTAGAWVLERAFEIFRELGAEAVRATDVGGTSSYLVHGTCRMGDDPATSVLDRWCRAHEVPNLYVVDGSFMPTSGGSPPTLTILANSFRVAEHVVERHRAGDFG